MSTTYHFEYSRKADFGEAVKSPTASAGSGSGSVAFSSEAGDLIPGTTYFYRLVASNGSGTTTGAASSFTTTQGFGFRPGTSGFAVSATSNSTGAPASISGSHPYELTFTLGMRLGDNFESGFATPFPDGDIRSLHIQQPPGLTENPAVIFRCSRATFQNHRQSPYEASQSGERCPDDTQIGTADVLTSRNGGQELRFGVFNLPPTDGVPARLGFSPFSLPFIFDLNLRRTDAGEYQLTLDATEIPEALDASRVELHLWGAPHATEQDGERGNCLNEVKPEKPHCQSVVISRHRPPKTPGEAPEPCNEVAPDCLIDSEPSAYLTLPHSCSGPISFAARAGSWRQPGEVAAQTVNRSSAGTGLQIEMGTCVESFKPEPVAQLDDFKASSPSGFNFRLEVDNSGLFRSISQAPVPPRKAVLTLPNGVSINPSTGSGLGFCTPAQYAAESAFSKQGEGCPNVAKIGDFGVRSLLFEERFTGAVYLVARAPVRGLFIGLTGTIVPDRVTGRLAATFDHLPQLPYGELDLSFRTGQRALLVMQAGKRGLLVNSANTCVSPPLVAVRALGQANRGVKFSTVLRAQCKKGPQGGVDDGH